MHTATLRLGLWENLNQFSLLVLVNVFVGAMVGLERSILPAIAEQEFHLAARAAILSFIVVFGVMKAIGDVAHPAWRASAVGVYRLWRDLGYAVGALLAGITADLFGLASALWLVAGLTFLSGVIVAVRMSETLVKGKA